MSKITVCFLLLFSYLGFSQSSKILYGKVGFQESYQNNVDVINFNTKLVTQTNEFGEFRIAAKVNDVLIFMSEDFKDQTHEITAEEFEKKTIIITLHEKPIELEEVTVNKVQNIKVNVGYNDLALAKIEKQQSQPKNDAVYTGETVNGVDFIQIGRMIGKGLGKLFKSKKKKEELKNIDVSKYISSNFSNDFFIKTIGLTASEIQLFISFCESDPKAKEIVGSEDEFAIMDFLVSKKEAFMKNQE